MKKYIFYTAVIGLYLYIPCFISNISLKHFFEIFGATSILIAASLFSKYLFAIISLFSLIISTILIHLTIHLGNAKDFDERIEIALMSSQNEKSEYLKHFISITDIIEILYLIIGIGIIFWFLKTQKIQINKKIKYSALFTFIIGVIIGKNGITPYVDIRYIIKAKEKVTNLKKRAIFLKKHFKYINFTPEYNKVVLIIGESKNKHFMNVYGYKIQDTPFLSNLKNLYIFDAFSPANLTKLSVPVVLSYITNTHFKDFYHTKSIVTTFNELNYTTYFISNQLDDENNISLTSSIANEAKIKYFPKHTTYDSVLVKYLYSIPHNKKKEFYLFHLIGSHFVYDLRYPKDKALFKNPTNIQQKYVNTIYYTDSILKQIFNYFKNDKALIIYLSDHGETIRDDGRPGHGMTPSYKDAYEIPFIIFSSINNPKLKTLKKLNFKKFNAQNLPYMIEYLIGLTNEANISYSDTILMTSPKRKSTYSSRKFYKGD